MTCQCDACRLSDKLASALKERDYFKSMAVQLMELVDRQKVNYAERVQLESLQAKLSTPE